MIERRRLDEDTTRQEANLRDAYADLEAALDSLTAETRKQSRAALRGAGGHTARVDEDALRAAWNRVDRALGDVDVRTYDLGKARGEHG